MRNDDGMLELFRRIGERIALDLAEQAARSPADAARAAGCSSADQIAAWIRVHRADRRRA
jgi:hypothetical protein